MKNIIKVFIILIVFILINCVVEISKNSGSKKSKLNQNSGWTQTNNSSDTKIYYVSSSQGNDSNDGTSSDTPVKTLAKAFSLLRNGYPDHLLLKCGDIWDESININNLYGKSESEPIVITSYGNGSRPQIRPQGSSPAIQHFDNLSHVYYIGLEFYDKRLDSTLPGFDPSLPDLPAGASNGGIFILGAGNDVLIEDCSFRYLGGGITIQAWNGFSPVNIKIRRNVIADNYGLGGNNQGMFFYQVNGLLLEENIFDHNGWNDAVPGASATVFSHNSYIDECNNVTLRGNMYLRAASLSAKFRSDHTNTMNNILVENNLFFESEVGMAIGQNNTTLVPLTSSNVTIRNNIFLQTNRDNPTARGLGTGLDVDDVFGADINNNIFTDFSYNVGNTEAISLQSISNTNITIHNNLFYRINDKNILLLPQSNWSNIKIQNNTFQDPDQGSAAFFYAGDDPIINNFSFNANTYFTNASSSMFSWISNATLSNGGFISYNTWLSQSNETGSTYKKINYPDPIRNLESYEKSLGDTSSNTDLLNNFMKAIRKQSKSSWNTNYTAPAINDYIRSGFGISQLGH